MMATTMMTIPMTMTTMMMTTVVIMLMSMAMITVMMTTTMIMTTAMTMMTVTTTTMTTDRIQISIVYPPDTDTPQLAAENEIKPPETARITGNAQVLSAEAVATAVLKGIRKRRFQITPGWEMTTLALLHSLIGPLLQRYFDGLVAKMPGRDRSETRD